MTVSAEPITLHGVAGGSEGGGTAGADSRPSGSTTAPPAGSHRPSGIRLYLLGGFELAVAGRPVSIPVGLKRILALLAVRGHGVTRSYIAGTLWTDASEDRAHGSLRSHLSRLRSMGLDLVEKLGDSLELSRVVAVDLHEANRAARSVLGTDADRVGTDEVLAGDPVRAPLDPRRTLLDPRMTSELLPGWYDEWVLAERERHRQLTLHALELLCTSFAVDRRHADAVLAGLAAINQEPLRESSHRALIRAHMAADNPGEALRCYERYRGLAAEVLGVEPSAAMQALVAGVGGTTDAGPSTAAAAP